MVEKRAQSEAAVNDSNVTSGKARFAVFLWTAIVLDANKYRRQSDATSRLSWKDVVTGLLLPHSRTTARAQPWRSVTVEHLRMVNHFFYGS